MAECFRIEVQENYQIGGFLGAVGSPLPPQESHRSDNFLVRHHMAECFRIEVQENYQIGGFLGAVAENLQLSVFDSLFPLIIDLGLSHVSIKHGPGGG